MTITPAEAWATMRAGNERFVAGEPLHPHQDAQHRREVAAGQTPHAVVFCCSDSRLAAEIIFDQGFGDLFVIRNAGQVASDSTIGSIEFAVAVLHTPLVIVLGHEACGAVRAAIDSTAPDAPSLPLHIRHLVEKVLPAVQRIAAQHPEVPTHRSDAVETGREHVRGTIEELLEASSLISDAVAAGRLAVVGANYRLAAGRVEPDMTVGLA